MGPFILPKGLGSSLTLLFPLPSSRLWLVLLSSPINSISKIYLTLVSFLSQLLFCRKCFDAWNVAGVSNGVSPQVLSSCSGLLTAAEVLSQNGSSHLSLPHVNTFMAFHCFHELTVAPRPHMSQGPGRPSSPLLLLFPLNSGTQKSLIPPRWSCLSSAPSLPSNCGLSVTKLSPSP